MINTDKYYWHRYIPEYERLVFSQMDPEGDYQILEFGVWEGESIRFLADRFKWATITGIDILVPTPHWPTSDRIIYEKVDQGSSTEVRAFFKDKTFDLIIDDGSHVPQHQATCLIEGMKHLEKGGFYILEDIHTSFSYLPSSPLVILLALKHLRETNQQLTLPRTMALTSMNFIHEDIYDLDGLIKEIYTFKRSSLPLQCWQCRGVDFNYKTLTCKCGVDLYKKDDSISFIIKTY
jgi:hypothetical protein